LDNCHVRVCFATNDERTARRVSDALGTATELRAMKNYAGHRLSPWLGHLMVSRQETARPLLTPGEIMQLPPGDELVLVSGYAPIRAKKARYYEDRRLIDRMVAPPKLVRTRTREAACADDWSKLPLPLNRQSAQTLLTRHQPAFRDPANAGIRQEPELPCHEEITPKKAVQEFTFTAEKSEDEVVGAELLRLQARRLARQAVMDPKDGLEL
jgi:type IV secretion system protein VirD4